jgi:hypothetical protein
LPFTIADFYDESTLQFFVALDTIIIFERFWLLKKCKLNIE